MANFFQNLAEQFKAIPGLIGQMPKTAEAKATETRLAKELEVKTTPITTPQIAPKITTPTIPVADFFSSLAQKMKEFIPEPKPELLKPIVSREEIEKITKPIAEAIFPKPIDRTGKAFQDALKGLQSAFEVPAVKTMMEPFIAISKAAGGALAGTLAPKGETLKEWYQRQPMAFEEVQRILEKTAVGQKLPVLPIAAGFVAEALLPPYFGKSGKFFDDIAKITDKGAVKNLLVKGVKDITEKEADDLAKRLAPITDKKIIQRELGEWMKAKIALPEAVKPKVPVKPPVEEIVPKIPTKISGEIADEAIKFAKENPESSLVAKGFRNKYTKELESGPKLFKRIGEAIKSGEINVEDLPKVAQKYNLPKEEVARLFEDAASYSGRTLQSLSRVEKALKDLIPDIEFPKRIPTLWEKTKSYYLAMDNFRRGLLVTQLATAARNAISQAKRYSVGTLTDGMNGVISKIIGKGEGFTPVLEDVAAIFRKMERGNTRKLQNSLKDFPIENSRLYNTPVGDVALTGKITNTLNALNRAQEYFFRNLVLDAKLNSASKINKVPIEKLGVDDIAKAVDEALEWTYAKSPARGSFGDAIMRTYRAMPFLTLINPFPRFMSNAVKFLYDYSPAGIMSLFSPKTRAAIAGGDYNAISKAIIGTSMLGGAIAIRANNNLAGEKWYEIKVGDKSWDTRAFAPFSTYLFIAEIMVNGTKRITGSDWMQAAIGINRVAGTGLALVDLVQQKVDYKNAKQIMNNIVSTYIGGFTVPFVTIKDIIGNYRLEERMLRETREVPIVGGALGNIPGLNEILPEKYSMFQDKPMERELPLLRQFTGLTFKTKPFIEKELDRMGKQIVDLVPKTGNLQANRIITKQTGVILDKFNDKIEMSENYKNLGDDEKLEFLKDLISEAKKEAKGEMASDLAGVVYNELKKVKGKERKKVIQDLKNRGLMTENILDYLLPMIKAQPF